MRPLWLILATLALPVAQAPQTTADIVSQVRAAIAAGDLQGADLMVSDERAKHGVHADTIEALSWLGSGALAAGQLDRASGYAREAQRLAVVALGGRPIESDPHFVSALGNAIEVEAQVRAKRDRSDAISFLQQALDLYNGTAIHKKIQKNINLLSLEGHPAPSLDVAEFIGPKPPTLARLKGKVVVLFFWAHWCPDCKIESPILAGVFAKYRARGLAIIAPTQRYGYVAGGAAAGPEEELRYIVQVRDTYYRFLADVPVPVSEANHKRYGVSSTPTIVIVDRQGIVRLYHPGRMTEDELDAQVRPLLDSGTGRPAPQVK